MIRITPLNYARYVATKLRAKASYAARRRATGAQLTLIGGCHGENTGDWAMSEVLMAEARRRGIIARRLAMRDAKLLSNAPMPLIIGGGAVGTADALEPVAKAWSSLRFPVTFVGVDFAADLDEFSPEIRDMCRCATSIGLRHDSQRERVENWSGNSNVYSHADIAFALSSVPRRQRVDDLVAINVLPVFRSLAGRTFVAASALESMYRRQKSGLADNISTIAESYVAFMVDAVQKFINGGSEIVHLPFAPEDDAFARTILPKSERIRFISFTRDLGLLERTIARSHIFLPTRFHALVAGLRTYTSIMPIAYAGKSSELLKAFGVASDAIIDRKVISEGHAAPETLEVSCAAVVKAKSSALTAVERSVSEAIYAK
jgi:hypothetical protein